MIDPIDAEKAAKPRLDLIPPLAALQEAHALAAGARKHGALNYRIPGHEQSLVDTHFASALRHINAWHRGEKIDPESGADRLTHLGCARAQLGIMIDLIENPPGDVFHVSGPRTGLRITDTEREAMKRC